MDSLIIAILFIIYSFLGWILDSVDRSLTSGKWSPGGFSRLPFCPSYGFGAFLIVIATPYITALHIVWEFLILGIGLSLFELAAGIFSLKFFKRRLWDYSHKPFNIQGHTDLFHVFAWGLTGLVFLYIVHPFVLRITKGILY